MRQWFLEGGGFEVEAGALVKAEQQVHIVYGLSGSPFQQVVDNGNYQQFAGRMHLLVLTTSFKSGIRSLRNVNRWSS